MTILTDQQRRMAEQNHGLIVSFIRKNRLDFDEYYGDLAETYCVAIASYDPSKGRLSTYVFVSLGNKLKNIYCSRSFEKTIPAELLVSLDEPVTAYGRTYTHADIICDHGVNVESEVQLRMAWEQMLKEFTPFEKELLNNIINRERTQRELAVIYGTSQTTYAKWEKAVKDKAYRILFGMPN